MALIKTNMSRGQLKKSSEPDTRKFSVNTR